MAEIKLNKTQFKPFLDVSSTWEKVDDESWSPSWKRIDRSTIFALNPNPETEETDYISYETPVTEIKKYKPELPQEIALYQGNPLYDYMAHMFYNLPVGSATVVPLLMVFPETATAASGSTTYYKAWQVQQCVVTLGELNTPDSKLSFTLGLGGDIEKGCVTISSGVPTFVKGAFSGTIGSETFTPAT